MSTCYLSEVRMMSFGFAPKGWALCNGQTLPIQQNAALFSLLGTTYGGDGIRTFNLPNLQARVPMSYGTDTTGTQYVLGQQAGEYTHTLLSNELPGHIHMMNAFNGPPTASAAGADPGPTVVPAEATAILAGGGTSAVQIYSNGPANIQMAANTVGPNGGNQPHENEQPYLTINFCIALQGIFPSQG